jgi:hypothetical protein
MAKSAPNRLGQEVTTKRRHTLIRVMRLYLRIIFSRQIREY